MAPRPHPNTNAKRIAQKVPTVANHTPDDTGMRVLLAHKRQYSDETRAKFGKPHVRTLELSVAIERAVGLGMTQEQICYLTGISQPTLYKNYRQELTMGGAVLQSAVASTLASIALDPSDKRSVDAAKFILARKFGWTEKTEIDMNANVQSSTVLDARALSPEDRGQLRDLLVQALAKAPMLEDRTQDAEYEDVPDEDDSAEDLL